MSFFRDSVFLLVCHNSKRQSIHSTSQPKREAEKEEVGKQMLTLIDHNISYPSKKCCLTCETLSMIECSCLMYLCVYNIDKVVVDRTKEASVAHPPVMFMAVILTASSSWVSIAGWLRVVAIVLIWDLGHSWRSRVSFQLDYHALTIRVN